MRAINCTYWYIRVDKKDARGNLCSLVTSNSLLLERRPRPFDQPDYISIHQLRGSEDWIQFKISYSSKKSRDKITSWSLETQPWKLDKTRTPSIHFNLELIFNKNASPYEYINIYRVINWSINLWWSGFCTYSTISTWYYQFSGKIEET